MDPRLTKVEFTFNQQEPDSIIIPLHSPDGQPAPPIHIDPPDLTAETVQTISEVVAAIEELKSQPVISPVPTPTSTNTMKKEEIIIEAVKTELPAPKIEIGNQIEHANSEHENLEDPVESSYKDKPSEEKVEPATQRQELEVQLSQDTDVSPRSETSCGSSKTQLEAPIEKQESDKKSDTETVKTGSEGRRSSESEPDSEAMTLPPDQEAEDDHERKGLFLQQESLEDELPYVPTTLPQERPVAHPIIPVKQRVAEVKTFPIERPRSTTPINPTTLDDYVASPQEDPGISPREKMQIVLPRTESLRENRSKSPHKPAAKPWTHFAEQGLQSPRELRRVASPSPPPPLPPRSSATWVCFDEVPERRRTPKRITTLPPAQPASASSVVYSYVNPDECSCECHGTQTQCSDTAAHCHYNT